MQVFIKRKTVGDWGLQVEIREATELLNLMTIRNSRGMSFRITP